MKRPFPVLTMTSDWGLRDHYVAAFKGQILNRSPEIRIVDISNEIEQFNILQASFLLRNAFPHFPPGTIHYIGIDSNNASRPSANVAPVLAVKSGEHIFVGKDSGIFSLILGEAKTEIYKLDIDLKRGKSVMAIRLSEMISHLINGRPLKEIGESQEGFVQSFLTNATSDSSSIRASVMYVDDFGNTIINITEPEFTAARKNRDFTINVRRSSYNISKISKTYEDAIVGEIVAFFNEDGYLEIALNRSSASGLLGMKIFDPIRIEFKEEE